MIAFELLCQYCYYNDISIVPVEKAREIAEKTDRESLDNYYPNPMFKQSLLKMFGGSSASKDAYLPDGFIIDAYTDGDNIYSVYKRQDGFSELKIESSNGSRYNLYQKIYGLKSGKYRLSFTSATASENARIQVFKRTNGTLYESLQTPIYSVVPSKSYAEYSVEFEIEEPTTKNSNTSPADQYSFGYTNNVCNIEIVFYKRGDVSDTLVFAKPKLERIN